MKLESKCNLIKIKQSPSLSFRQDWWNERWRSKIESYSQTRKNKSLNLKCLWAKSLENQHQFTGGRRLMKDQRSSQHPSNLKWLSSLILERRTSNNHDQLKWADYKNRLIWPRRLKKKIKNCRRKNRWLCRIRVALRKRNSKAKSQGWRGRHLWKNDNEHR